MVWFSIIPICGLHPSEQVSSNLYLGGCHGVESPSEKEQAAFAARVTGAKYVEWHIRMRIAH